MVILEGKKCYTVAETAEILVIGQTAVRRAIDRGKLQPVIISGRKYIPDTEIKEYDQQRKGRKHDS